ncbi:TPA: DinI-like family protein [Yersinia enterocolitica]
MSCFNCSVFLFRVEEISQETWESADDWFQP